MGCVPKVIFRRPLLLRLQKTLLMGGGVGLGLVIMACALYIVIAVRLDLTVYTRLDLQKVTTRPVFVKLP